MAEHPELRQLHLVAHPHAGEAVAPMVPNIAHCVPDSGDMPNTQNAITYAAEASRALTRPPLWAEEWLESYGYN